MKRDVTLILLLICLEILNPRNAEACDLFQPEQTRQDSTVRYMVRPSYLKPLTLKSSMAVLFTQLPYDWLENSIEVPVFSLNGKLGIRRNLSLDIKVLTLFVSNQLRVGPKWYHENGNFSFGAGIDGEYMFGKMRLTGFNNRIDGWAVYPVLMTGYKVNKLAFSLSAEAAFINSLKIKTGDQLIIRSHNNISGFTVTLLMEQPLWKNHTMILGFVNNWQKFFFPAWPVFPTFTRHYYIPQFCAGFVL